MARKGTLDPIFDELAIAVLGTLAVASEALKEPVATQESRLGEADGRPVAAPSPFARMSAETGTHRVQRDIPEDLEEMRLGFDLFREEPILEQMAFQLMAPVEPLRIDRVQPVHS